MLYFNVCNDGDGADKPVQAHILAHSNGNADRPEQGCILVRNMVLVHSMGLDKLVLERILAQNQRKNSIQLSLLKPKVNKLPKLLKIIYS